VVAPRALTDAKRRDLAEVSEEDRCVWTSTLFAGQRPPTAWHAPIGEQSVADAICDLLIHQAHRLSSAGSSRDSEVFAVPDHESGFFRGSRVILKPGATSR
jgi:hypothetical protein